jgi:hypothetical protein
MRYSIDTDSGYNDWFVISFDNEKSATAYYDRIDGWIVEFRHAMTFEEIKEILSVIESKGLEIISKSN